SSRRRHTRCLSDWSSDVCSSDLEQLSAVPPARQKFVLPLRLWRTSVMRHITCSRLYWRRAATCSWYPLIGYSSRCLRLTSASARSEERRVGKEGSFAWPAPA